mmetsp:Transcript_51859/g.138315  ORF Transcript_51859/g.138315 Transcript_51859/m.138315 type:complete len:83 (-) Transcript_51859:83-331(-)
MDWSCERGCLLDARQVCARKLWSVRRVNAVKMMKKQVGRGGGVAQRMEVSNHQPQCQIEGGVFPLAQGVGGGRTLELFHCTI